VRRHDLLATDVLDGRPDQRSFGAIDLTVRRNAFGRQVDSFEADIAVAGLPGGPFHAVFIRAPYVETVGPAVEVLASIDDHPVLCRQGPVLAAAFHPELSGDLRLHELFMKRLVGMSGHSKWARSSTRRVRRTRPRGKLFAKLIRQVEVAARRAAATPT